MDQRSFQYVFSCGTKIHRRDSAQASQQPCCEASKKVESKSGCWTCRTSTLKWNMSLERFILDLLSDTSYLSSETKTSRKLKATIVTEDTVVLDTIKEETQGDEILQKLRRTFKTGNWERAKKDVDLVPFYLLKDELYDPPRMLFRMERVVQPTSLQQKIIKTAHNQ